MRVIDGQRLYFASDLVKFLGCTHATMLGLEQLASPVSFPDDDETAKLLQRKASRAA